MIFLGDRRSLGPAQHLDDQHLLGVLAPTLTGPARLVRLAWLPLAFGARDGSAQDTQDLVGPGHRAGRVPPAANTRRPGRRRATVPSSRPASRSSPGWPPRRPSRPPARLRPPRRRLSRVVARAARVALSHRQRACIRHDASAGSSASSGAGPVVCSVSQPGRSAAFVAQLERDKPPRSPLAHQAVERPDDVLMERPHLCAWRRSASAGALRRGLRRSVRSALRIAQAVGSIRGGHRSRPCISATGCGRLPPPRAADGRSRT